MQIDPRQRLTISKIGEKRSFQEIDPWQRRSITSVHFTVFKIKAIKFVDQGQMNNVFKFEFKKKRCFGPEG